MRMLAIFLAFAAQFAYADCPQFYPLGKTIAVPNAVELCNSFYAVDYDQAKNQVIISVEKFRSGERPRRSGSFHPDPRLDAATRPNNSDYQRSGYDKGHMTPAADATNDAEMRDTFLLSNMTPQDPTLNRQAWRMLEMQVRELAPDYVVTGAIYSDAPETIGNHRVPVPVGYYKIIWKAGSIRAWHAENKPDAPINQVTLQEIEQKSGLKFPEYAPGDNSVAAN